ncbi:hypothetical protein E3Q22_00526 [Wallemia mellicola]|uniref:Uncharacterized protein n=2 Tax=Wallemia mellicola TaxID=1708541 RepID=I4Y5H0_WALMC|nr:hypothetical protein WALSEDRAFT_61563 [Wallemia mellicola CBS 633.66]TIB79829.1 hypothetical protein E3Q21_04040 [Wallemia mellicola]EIM19212.1 hypothetical protein WALSEDRAFT_61563 [Wallemia mellicola CBS 633.66]TIB82182.1 hypothetical protein E3Q22_00526 [Wallemia mellicola]TIB83778.1 hypothetical protein E3Q20_03993 [Wallemia mellicola]TIC17645.1 hypothetical protein E3Q15_00548 [Wallemia mellicola]|eukprot:XP_006960709.1 hypothetical protein WALSEDRAFT_61563 [Wallemia mellicola CBS 633.66]
MSKFTVTHHSGYDKVYSGKFRSRHEYKYLHHESKFITRSSVTESLIGVTDDYYSVTLNGQTFIWVPSAPHYLSNSEVGVQIWSELNDMGKFALVDNTTLTEVASYEKHHYLDNEGFIILKDNQKAHRHTFIAVLLALRPFVDFEDTSSISKREARREARRRSRKFTSEYHGGYDNGGSGLF